MTEDRSRPLSRSRPWFALAVALLALLTLNPAPMMPALSLDASWIQAVEYGADHGLVFGRDIIFTYGPFAVLATRLFASHSFVFVLLFSLLLTLFWLLPLTLDRPPLVVALYAAALLIPGPTIDSRLVAALVALAVVGVEKPSAWIGLAATAFGPLGLAKYSYLLSALPVFVLIDAYYLLALRRVPLATAGLLASVAVSLLLAGQPPATWVSAAYYNWQVVDGYSGAMQATAAYGGFLVIVALLALMAATLAVVGIGAGCRVWRSAETLCLLAVVLWCCFISFKMGFVRQDMHVALSWQALVLMVPPVAVFAASRATAGGLPQRLALWSLPVWLAAALIGLVTLTWHSEAAADPDGPIVRRSLGNLAYSPIQTLAWLSPARWREAAAERRAAEASIRRRYSPLVTGTVDSIPIRVTPLIVSGLDYHPRPVPQSYSSYTPALQGADAAFFADPARAPQTILYVLAPEVDDRLPALGLGPSLPILMRWYDVVGTDRDAAVLRRRAVPRPARVEEAGARDVRLGEWVAVPSGGTTTLAAIDLDKRIGGRLLKFLLREPQLYIDLRFADGSMREFRFIPGMAEAGFGLSPTPLFDPRRPTAAARAMIDPRQRSASAGGRVTAFRIVGGRISAFAYGPAHVRFRILTVANGE